MSIVSTVTKAWAAKKLLLFLTKDITQLQAFKLGIIDANGDPLIARKDMTPKQKEAFGPYEKICLYVRRVLKKHGVASLAIALTYIEEERYDEFMIHFKEMGPVDIPAGANQYSDRYGTLPVDAPPRHSQYDDFNRNVMLLERVLIEDKEIVDEDAPTTSTAGIATYPVPLMRREKNKDYEA